MFTGEGRVEGRGICVKCRHEVYCNFEGVCTSCFSAESVDMPFIFFYNGYQCAIIRTFSGHCGYVKVFRGHPCFEKTWDSGIDNMCDAHMGVTWNDHCLPGYDSTENCWWIGFDTAHYCDDLHTKSRKYVIEAVKRLADSLDKLVKKESE